MRRSVPPAHVTAAARAEIRARRIGPAMGGLDFGRRSRLASKILARNGLRASRPV